MLDPHSKKIGIIGAQRSGLAIAELVTELGGQACVSEMKQENEVASEIAGRLSDLKAVCEFGGSTKEFIDNCDYIVLSPGVWFNSPVVSWAKEAGIPVLGEIEFAYQFCDKPVIAVTGSNGKTTVSTLIDLVCKEARYRSCLCGNIGNPFAGSVLDLKDIDYVVLEISSFQLESLISGSDDPSLKRFRPHIGVFLNFSRNHLDRHKDLDEYFNAKAKLFTNQEKGDFAVLNGEDERIKQLADTIPSNSYFFNSSKTVEEFRIENPNYLAVLQVANILKINPHVALRAISDFKGVEHRLERVRTLEEVNYINDSKATTTEAGRWALNSFDEPIFMICGGRDKNSDFTALSNIVSKKVKKMYVIGEAKEKIKNAFCDAVKIEECSSLDDAVSKAKKDTKPGDNIVLSPMCASFDMFKDYEDRGRVFKEIVNNLKEN